MSQPISLIRSPLHALVRISLAAEWGPHVVMAGTTLRYKPGIVTGGPGLVHDCGTSRAIGWFLEPLAVIALFGKKVWRPHS